jgi:hypothetical protein
VSDSVGAARRFDDQHASPRSPRTSGDSRTVAETALGEQLHTYPDTLAPDTLANQLAIALCRRLGL